MGGFKILHLMPKLPLIPTFRGRKRRPLMVFFVVLGVVYLRLMSKMHKKSEYVEEFVVYMDDYHVEAQIK